MGSKRKVSIAWILFVITLLIILIRVAIWVIWLDEVNPEPMGKR
jgi:heme/copper-type cytochrome/quinol oxidase subunit 4